MNDYPNQEYHSVSKKNTESASDVSTGNVSATGQASTAVNGACTSSGISAANAASNIGSPGTAGQIPSADNSIQIDNTIQTGNISHADGHTSQTGSASHTGDNPTQTSQPWVFTPAAPAAPQPNSLSEEEKEKRIRHFRLFSMTSVIYALFYTFCLYKNASGITYPFFTGGTLFCFFLSLKKLGINIFYDKESLEWGDNWKDRILNGTKHAEFAIIVISENFFDREWTERELSEFLNKQNKNRQKIILPIIHNITTEELKKKYPNVADLQVIDSKKYTSDEIALLLARNLIKRYKE